MRLGRRWLGYNTVALAACLPFEHVFEGTAVSVLFAALLVIVAQACFLRRVCRWWLWVPVSCVGCYASDFAGMYLWVITFGCTMSLAQGLCLLGWSFRTAAAWVVLGSAGWVAGMMSTVLLDQGYRLLGLGSPGMIALWVCLFGVQGAFLLPGVVMLDKVVRSRAQAKQETA
jgi:hypothetical protein